MARDAITATKDNIRALRELLVGRSQLMSDGPRLAQIECDPLPVLFLGSGFSKWLADGADCPEGWRSTWQELARCMANLAEPTHGTELLDLLDDPAWNRPTEELFDSAEDLCGQTYWENLCDTFYREGQTIEKVTKELKIRSTRRLALAKALFTRVAGVVTTNYDPLAWAVAVSLSKEANGRDWSLAVFDVDHEIPFEFLALLRRGLGERWVVYLNGSILDRDTEELPTERHVAIDRISKAIISNRNYVRAYGSLGDGCDIETQRGTLLKRTKFIPELFRLCPIVLVGFSLKDRIIDFYISHARRKQMSNIEVHSVIDKHFAVLGLDKNSENGNSGQRAMFGSSSLVRHWEEVMGIHPIFTNTLVNKEGNLCGVEDGLDVVLDELGLNEKHKGRDRNER